VGNIGVVVCFTVVDLGEKTRADRESGPRAVSEFAVPTGTVGELFSFRGGC